MLVVGFVFWAVCVAVFVAGVCKAQRNIDSFKELWPAVCQLHWQGAVVAGGLTSTAISLLVVIKMAQLPLYAGVVATFYLPFGVGIAAVCIGWAWRTIQDALWLKRRIISLSH